MNRKKLFSCRKEDSIVKNEEDKGEVIFNRFRTQSNRRRSRSDQRRGPSQQRQQRRRPRQLRLK